MSAVKHAVVAAAGLGSRLGLGQPKCLVEIAGRSLLAHLLDRLSGVPDVRIVVGFGEDAVVAAARKLRDDIIFVRNPAFRTTTTLHSYELGARHLNEPCLFMDADILFEPRTFQEFLEACQSELPLIGITTAKTADCVYAHRDESGRVSRFSRTEVAMFEWANLAWLPPGYFASGTGAVFERLGTDLPMKAREIVCYECDTTSDLAQARLAAGSLELATPSTERPQEP